MDLSCPRRRAQDTFDTSHFIPQCWEPGSEDPRPNLPLCSLRRRSLPRQGCRGRRGGVHFKLAFMLNPLQITPQRMVLEKSKQACLKVKYHSEQ